MTLSSDDAELTREDLDAMIDSVETLATLLGDLSKLDHPTPGSLIAAQRLAESIASNGDSVLRAFRIRAGLPILSTRRSLSHAAAVN